MEYEVLKKLIYQNQLIKKQEIKNINQLKKLYDEIKQYIQIPCPYDEIITDSYIRMCFLKDTINTTFQNQNINNNTKYSIFEMYEKIYDYLCKDSNLEEIEIPEELIQKLFDRKYIPKESELSMVITLLKENKRIYELEIKNKYFSQTLQVGFHKGIIKDLRIEEQNLPHLLGLTNDGSLYEFYRKIMLQKEIQRILNILEVKAIDDPNLDYQEFNQMFKDKFGLDYSEESCKKIINWRYNAEEDYLKKRGITVTEKEREILNQSNDYAPKSKTLEFYCMEETLHLLEEENNKIKIFIYEYIKKATNDNNVTLTNINEYIEKSKYKLEEDKNFKISFVNTFGYSYPLINYYELLSKNISFYNFSLFKNLHSIIVDYDSHSKKIESDVFLASYNQNKMKSIKESIIELIKEKDEVYAGAITGAIIDPKLNKDYIMRAKSLSSFPENNRYYFEYGFLSKDKRKQDDDIIFLNSPKHNNITLIGFKASKEEKERLKELEKSKRRRVKHFLNCETNITSNYYQYETDFTRCGIEYPIELIEERGELPRNNKKYKVLKMEKPLDKLSRYITMFESCKYNEDVRKLEHLTQDILEIIDDYEQMTFMKLAIMEYRIETRNIKQQDIYNYRIEYEKEISESRQMLDLLLKYKEYIEKIINDKKTTNKHKRR